MQGIKIRLERIVCICGNYCTFKICNVKFISRDVANANVKLVLKREGLAYKFTFKTFYQFSNNEYRPILVSSNAQIDYCAIQAGKYNSPLHTAIMNVLGNHTNINRKCPFPPGEYFVTDLNAQVTHLPNIVPSGRYLINSTAYQQFNDWVYNISIYVTISNYGTTDFGMG